jgi:hypothetical protein
MMNTATSIKYLGDSVTECPLRISEAFGIDLSSRSRGALLRATIENSVDANTAVLDFASVRTVSNSFADEVFGVLAVRHGKEWLVKRIRITNATAGVRVAITEAIADRLSPKRRGRTRRSNGRPDISPDHPMTHSA